jgi:very-short-patch-repair endonuclease
VKFRRQHPIGPYIVDFACLSPRLVIEADGWSHGHDDPVYVAARDRFLRGRGFAVLHLSDATVNYDLDNALRAIRAVMDDPAEQWRFNRME